jgi:O-antigen/teichoic acid export membrane protein
MIDPLTDLTEQAVDAGSSRHVARGSAWFIAALGLGAMGGFAFWWLAARLQPASTVGEASAMFTAILFIAYLTSMGLPVAVAKYGSLDHPATHSLWSWALVYTAATSLVGATVFMAVAPASFTDDLGAFGAWSFPAQVGFLFVMVTGMAFAVLVETRLVTLRSWRWVLGRVAVLSIGRLPLLFFGPLASNPLGLVLLMAGAPALSGLLGVVAFHYAAPRGHRQMRVLPQYARPALRFATVNWLGMLAAQAPQFTVPLIVAAEVPSAENAAFYLAWSMTTVTFLVPQTIGQVVVSEGSRAEGSLNHKVRIGFAIALAAMVVLALGALVLAPLATKIFGPSYELTATVLPRLIAAGIPWAVTSVLLARSRVLDQTWVTVGITTTFAVLVLGSVALAADRSGPESASTAWLVANVVAAGAAIGLTLLANRKLNRTDGRRLVAFDGAPT